MRDGGRDQLLVGMLKRQEGLRLKPYYDTTEHLSIGYGRNLTDVGISQEEAEELLLNDIVRAAHELDTYYPKWRIHSWPRRNALLAMAFNLGVHRVLEFKKMIAALEEQDYERAAAEMLASHWAAQVGRRAKELAELMRAEVWP